MNALWYCPQPSILTNAHDDVQDDVHIYLERPCRSHRSLPPPLSLIELSPELLSPLPFSPQSTVQLSGLAFSACGRVAQPRRLGPQPRGLSLSSGQLGGEDPRLLLELLIA